MQTQDTRLESLVARCLDAGDAGYQAQLDQLCTAHPDAAMDLRARIAHLEQLGFLGARPGSSGSQWLPDRIGRYQLTGLLGRGGMGVVFRGHLDGGDEVAVKIVRPDLLGDERARERFRREALLLSRLSHPGICPLLEIGVDNDVPFLVMPLLRGQTLRAWLHEHRGDRDQLLAHLQSFARALHAAHEAGLVHRDVTPGNLFVTEDGRALVFDFGLARDTTGEVATLTLSHEQLGTLPYMAPEQLTGAAHIDRRADVYSLGVVLYEALAGRLPFESEHRSDLSRMILAGESPRLRRLVRELPRPLDSIVHKAIDVDPAHRYASAEEFAADLQRFGEGRPVLARDVGIGVRTRRWVRHHPVAATTISLLAVILVISASLTGALATKVREFSLLSGFVAYGQTVADESGLYPAIPKRADDMERWLRDGCDPLLQMRPELEDALQDLRARALPTTAADLETDRVTHPAFARLQRLEQRLAPMHRAQRIREGEPLVVPTLTETQLAIPARDLYALAHDRVVPDLDDRRILGEEPLGLAFARLLVEKGATFAQRYAYMDILAWALFANGQDAAAVEESNAALAEATAKGKALERAEYRENLRLLERAIASAPDELARMELEHKQLLATVTTRRTFRFASRADQFLHDHLAELITNLDALASDRVQVEQRLRWARQISSLTRAHPNAHCSWDTARKAIAQSEKYRGLGIELADEDVLGLVPIGMNPETKLWEFYDLRSAWDGKVDPATIPIPTHEPDGSIAVTEDTGIVFVLLPGGTSWMGAQAKSQELPNHDSDSGDIDSLQQVTLAPFFLARHETTQGQWARMWTWDDSRRYPSNRPVGKKAASHLITAANPVEFVSWEMCVTLLSRYDLRLPTEAQWEYACRAGTTGAWCCAKEELRLYANVRDQSAGLAWGGDVDAWDDGYAAHWPVGTGHANEFGLHDMHGNVWEWCQDGMANFSEARRQGDGLSLAGNRDARIHRGGCFDNSSMWARSAYRRADQPAFRGPGVGVRAARALRP